MPPVVREDQPAPAHLRQRAADDLDAERLRRLHRPELRPGPALRRMNRPSADSLMVSVTGCRRDRRAGFLRVF